MRNLVGNISKTKEIEPFNESKRGHSNTEVDLIYTELHKQGVNLNQLTKSINKIAKQNKIKKEIDEAEHFDLIIKHNQKVIKQCTEILNNYKRRMLSFTFGNIK